MLSLSIETLGEADEIVADEKKVAAAHVDEWSDWDDRGDEKEEENESLLPSSSSSPRAYEKETGSDSLLVNGRRNGRIRYSAIILIASLLTTALLVLFRIASRRPDGRHESSSSSSSSDKDGADHGINATIRTKDAPHYDFKAEVDNEYDGTAPNTINHIVGNETVVLKDAIANDPSLLDNPIIQILQVAKVQNITLEQFEALPQTAHNFQTLYHNGAANDIDTHTTTNSPIIIGLERCHEYRERIAPDMKDRYAAVAGMFNTGNNAFELAMMLNLQKHQPHAYVGKLPWGRHRMEQDRLHHVAPGFETLNQTLCLPILIVRDPLHWMHSMCKAPYGAKWTHDETRCPNLVPTEQDLLRWSDDHDDATMTSESFPVTVQFNNVEGHFDSLAALWSDWYRPYLLNATYPRIMIRFEDYLLYGPLILQQIAECMGFVDAASTTLMDEYRIETGSAKPHGSHTDFVQAIFKSGDMNARIQGLTRQDLQYAAQHLDPVVMKTFQYRV